MYKTNINKHHFHSLILTERHTHTHTYTHTYTYTRTHAHTHTYTHKRTHTHTHTRTHREGDVTKGEICNAWPILLKAKNFNYKEFAGNATIAF